MDADMLGYFVEAVEQCGSLKEGFCLAFVMFVPLAWRVIDRMVSRHGWVVQLWDGRRLYLEYRVDEARSRKPQQLVVRPLYPYQVRPELPNEAIHWFEPRHVNLALYPIGERVERMENHAVGR